MFKNIFSLQPSVLALSILALEIEEQKLLELTEALEFLQLHSKVCADKISGKGGRKMHGKVYTVGKEQVHWNIGFFCGFVVMFCWVFSFGLRYLAAYPVEEAESTWRK